MPDHADLIAHALADARAVLDEFVASPTTTTTIAAIGAEVIRTFRSGHKILVCGNGGSSCDAAHFAEELTGRFRPPPPGRPDRPPLPALACTDFGHITCTANDYGFEHVFSRWVAALAKPGDSLILLSTSGNSPNILRAAEAGRAAGTTVIGLLGKDGGKLRPLCDHALTAPGRTSDRIQEVHMMVLHILCELVEAAAVEHSVQRPS